MRNSKFLRAIACLLVASTSTFLSAAERETLNVWPGKAPGEVKELPPETDLTKPGDKPVGDRQIIKLTNVSVPTIALYRPEKSKDTGASVIVCPGGGHNILAFDHEGTEAAEWLAKIGVTGIVLKYRVPARNPQKRWEAAVQDAQRAVSLVRSKAAEWKLDPDRIGILGFSAGGETAGLTALLFEKRQYEPVDDVDKVSARPNFAMLIYPGGLLIKGQEKLQEHVVVPKDAPPMFFAHAFDDNVSVLNSLLLAGELKKQNIPTELHIYAAGGHGFGMRQKGDPANTWPDRCEAWMRRSGWLEKGAVK